jgi:hypothetical protein
LTGVGSPPGSQYHVGLGKVAAHFLMVLPIRHDARSFPPHT